MKKFIITFISAAVLIIVTLIILKSKLINTPTSINDIHFINTKIYAATNVGDDLTFPIVYLKNKDSKINEKISNVHFIDDTNIDIIKWELKDGSVYKDCKINNIQMTIKVTKGGEYNLKGIILDLYDGSEHTYKFNDLIIDAVDAHDKYITVATNETDMSSNSTLFFDFTNNSNQIIKLLSFDFASNSIKIANSSFTIDGNKKILINSTVLKKNQIIQSTISLKSYDNFDVAFIRPFIKYDIGNNVYKTAITTGTVFGMPFSPQKMESLYERYFKRNLVSQ